MSNLIINWRFLKWHLKVVQPSDWHWYRKQRQPIVIWGANPYRHKYRGLPLAIYEGKRYFAALVLVVALAVWWAL